MNMWYTLLAQTPEMTNSDAWQRTLTLLFGGGGIIGIIVKAALDSWKRSQKEANEIHREYIDFLKNDNQLSRATTQVLTTNLQAQTPILQSMEKTQEKQLEAITALNDKLDQVAQDAAADRQKKACKYVKTRPKKATV